MIDVGVEEGKYAPSEDTVISDLGSFQGFLYCHFKEHSKYKQIYPSSNQPARFFATAKTHKFETFDEINLTDIKLRPIINQSVTCYYTASQVVAKFLKPLAGNQYVIKDTQTFQSLLQNLPSLQPDEEDVSYDVESLFTNAPVDETTYFKRFTTKTPFNQCALKRSLKNCCMS